MREKGYKLIKIYLPLCDTEAETEKTSAEQLLFQKQRSLFPRVYCTSIDLIFDSDVSEVQQLLILLKNLFRRCFQHEETTDGGDDGDNSAMHLCPSEKQILCIIAITFTINFSKRYRSIHSKYLAQIYNGTQTFLLAARIQMHVFQIMYEKNLILII